MVNMNDTSTVLLPTQGKKFMSTVTSELMKAFSAVQWTLGKVYHWYKEKKNIPVFWYSDFFFLSNELNVTGMIKLIVISSNESSLHV